MNGPEAFYDTNVVLYLLSPDPAKADRAEALLAGGGRISVQVLNEFRCGRDTQARDVLGGDR